MFCDDLLVGVVAKDDRDFANRRLHAVRIHPVLADPQFTFLITEDTGTPPMAEAVERKPFLQPPAGPAQARTPPAAQLSEELTGQLAAMAAQADPAHRNHAATQLTALIAGDQETSGLAQLPRLVAPPGAA